MEFFPITAFWWAQETLSYHEDISVDFFFVKDKPL